MATLPREAHGLGMMLTALYLAASDARVRVIGADTPALQIAQAARTFQADAVGVSISAAASTVAVREQLDVLSSSLEKSTTLWLGGKGALRLDALPERAVCINHWDELEDALRALVARSVP